MNSKHAFYPLKNKQYNLLNVIMVFKKAEIFNFLSYLYYKKRIHRKIYTH